MAKMRIFKFWNEAGDEKEERSNEFEEGSYVCSR